MNAYIASFMLLLFNAVGLAVPASAATAERMMPELGSPANLSQATVADPCVAAEKATLALSDYQSCAILPLWPATPLAVANSRDNQPVWAVLATRSEAGDKLEHEEGAP